MLSPAEGSSLAQGFPSQCLTADFWANNPAPTTLFYNSEKFNMTATGCKTTGERNTHSLLKLSVVGHHTVLWKADFSEAEYLHATWT